MHTDSISPAFIAGIAFKMVNLLRIGVLAPRHATPRMAMVWAADGEHAFNQR